jgi:hypothetical protein
MLFCMVCRGEMPEERARQKKARVCSEKCKAEYRRMMGLERDKRICRLCGRRFRKARSLEGVNTDHNEGMEAVSLVTH